MAAWLKQTMVINLPKAVTEIVLASIQTSGAAAVLWYIKAPVETALILPFQSLMAAAAAVLCPSRPRRQTTILVPLPFQLLPIKTSAAVTLLLLIHTLVAAATVSLLFFSSCPSRHRQLWQCSGTSTLWWLRQRSCPSSPWWWQLFN